MVVSAKRQDRAAETELLKRREILSIRRLYGRVAEGAGDFATRFCKRRSLDVLRGARKGFGESSLQSRMTDNYP